MLGKKIEIINAQWIAIEQFDRIGTTENRIIAYINLKEDFTARKKWRVDHSLKRVGRGTRLEWSASYAYRNPGGPVTRVQRKTGAKTGAPEPVRGTQASRHSTPKSVADRSAYLRTSSMASMIAFRSTTRERVS